MAEIKFEDWLPQEINQGPPFPEFLGIYWPWYTPPGAEFKVSDLIISPTEVNPGQPVTITCLVTNIGAEAGSYTVKLGGDFMAETTVTLQPSESKTVSFEVTPAVAKSYAVSVDGQSGSFAAIEGILEFELVKPAVTPEEIYPGTTITLTCPVTSRCSNPQTATVKIIIYEGSILPGHGTEVTTKTSAPFSISPGESYNVIFHHTAIAGTIDRRDVEIEVHVSGKLVKQSEWDDVYYVAPAPAADIRLENLTIYPPEVPVGGLVAISVRATNYGSKAGTKKVVCTVT